MNNGSQEQTNGGPDTEPAPRFRSLREYVNSQPRTKTQGQIAAELGIAPNTLSQYLNGRSTPSKEIALRLSADFDISLEGLLRAS